MKTKKLFILYSLLFLFPATYAQTLKEVVRGTLITNPEIQALRANTKAYRLYVDEEEGKLYPSINLETFFEELNRNNHKSADVRLSGTNTQVKLEQTLFDGWLTPSKIEEAKKDFQATQYRNSATIEGVVLSAVDAYLNVVKNEEFRLLSENNLLIHEDYLQVATEAEEVSGDTLDRMQVESKIFSANAKFSEVKRDALQAKASLEKLYGKKINSGFCRPIVKDNDSFNDLEELLSEALTVNYSVLEEINRIKTQRAVVTQEKSRFYPTITAKLLHEVDDGVDAKNTRKTEDSFRITLNYNIFNGGQDAAILEREKLFLKESQKTLDDVVNRVIEEVKINYTSFHTAKKRIAYLENYLSKNKDILFVYLEQFEGGTRGFIDILNHEAELFRAKTDLIQEQFTYTLAYYELQNLLSRLSSTVLSTEKQICEEITVDVERRQLSNSEDETTADEELTAIFEEGEDAAIQEGDADDKDAKVQSMLNQILNEVYDPDSVNKNINVSQISHAVANTDVLPESDRKDEALKELIKIQQELEEKAIREERDTLKTQIKKAAESLIDESSKEESSKETKTQKKSKSQQEIKETIKTPKEQPVSKKEFLKDENTEENVSEKEETKQKNLSNKEENKNTTKKVVHEFTDDKLLSLRERQAISRKTGEKFKQLFREKNGLDENGYIKIEKEVIKTKEQTIKELSDNVEQKAKESASQNELKKVEEIKMPEKVLSVAEFKKDENEKIDSNQVISMDEKIETTKITKEKKEEQKLETKETKSNEAVIENKKNIVKNTFQSIEKNREIIKSEQKQEETPLIKTSLKEELFGPKSKKYTLGILTLSKKRKASFIKKHYNLEKNIIVYKSQNNGQTYFKVIYGVYDSAKEAKADIKSLHKTLQKNGVFVNRISTHQKLFKKYNPNGELE